MGIITLEQTDRLFWLGRYMERVYTTTRLYADSYDHLIDELQYDYRSFCEKVDIPDIYGSKEAFLMKYPFDPEDPNSLYSNLIRAYDNAIVLRNEIGSEALAYVQLCIYDLKKARESSAPMIELQTMVDHIMAFWGTADDMISSEQVRDILKTGKRVERIDLYGRLGFPVEDLQREVHRMKFRIRKSGMEYNENAVNGLNTIVDSGKIDYYEIVRIIESVI